MGILIQWPTKEAPTPIQLSLGEHLFNFYRAARIQQGWEEFLWKSLSETQQFVWHIMAKELQKGSE